MLKFTNLGKSSVNYAIAYFIFGFIYGVSEFIPLPKSQTVLLLVTTCGTLFVLKKEWTKIGFNGLVSLALILAFIASVFLSVLNLGFINAVIVSQIVKVAVYPLFGFIVFYTLKEKALIALLALFTGQGLGSLLPVTYLYAVGSVITTEGVERNIANPLNGEIIRATGAISGTASLIFLLFYYHSFRRQSWRLLVLVLGVLPFVFSIFVGGRTVLVAFVPVVALYLLVNSLRQNSIVKEVIGTIIVCIVCAGLFSIERFRFILTERFFSRFTSDQVMDTTLSGRTDIWSYGIQIAKGNPLGKGYVYTDEITGMSTHNTFLEVWVSYGILALLAFLVMFLHTALLGLKNLKISISNKQISIGSELVMISIFAYFMVEAHIYHKIGLLTFLFCFAGLFACRCDLPGMNYFLPEVSEKSRFFKFRKSIR